MEDSLDVAASAYNVPLAVPAITFLAVIGATVGRTRGLEVKPSWITHPNLYWALVAKSGTGKSPCSAAIMKPIHEKDQAVYQKHKQGLFKYEQDLNISESQKISTGINKSHGKSEKIKNSHRLGDSPIRSAGPEVPAFSKGRENSSEDNQARRRSTIHRRVDYDRITAELIGFDEPDRTGAVPAASLPRRQDSGLGAGNTRLPGLAERIGESFERVGKIVRSMKKLMWKFKKVRGQGAGLGM
ncbi:DUF3987 domain-containing protein [Marinifilum sp. JC120]|nr:DUF3987 domain-containing protein [Marinifilum sp. JC120]